MLITTSNSCGGSVPTMLLTVCFIAATTCTRASSRHHQGIIRAPGGTALGGVTTVCMHVGGGDYRAYACFGGGPQCACTAMAEGEKGGYVQDALTWCCASLSYIRTGTAVSCWFADADLLRQASVQQLRSQAGTLPCRATPFLC